MKILHTSDLHIGKRVNEYSMLGDQQFMLTQIADVVSIEKPDVIVLAGDIYDKSIPSAEAVCLFDDFLVRLASFGKPVFISSGNHDSAERLSFASRIMEISKIYLSPVYDGNVQPVVISDGITEVAFYMLPFIKPQTVAYYAGDDADIKTYDDAMRYAIGQMHVDRARRNVLIAHQFITDAERTESEDLMVGGLDNVDASAFDDFDYVALGHLHRSQSCGRDTVRYSGSPLKYSFSEVHDRKSVTIVEIDGDDEPRVYEHQLKPLHEWYDLRGTYDQLTAKAFYDGTDYQESYVRITLTDEDDVPDGKHKLQSIYHLLMELQYDNKRTRAGMSMLNKMLKADELDPLQILGQLYEEQNAQPLSKEQAAYAQKLIGEIFDK